ncbi:MAG TPA: translation elongation factor Ts [Anaerohalosphaeraceae bacterium]|jgi:elongation factor Ts|nr:translation elongation factor Ts [Anaerohalosphaeraceae bacterium]HRT51602.1 translation elongation factor Ts [Anaerohalosphaeraceae bacterium]HRT87618.1 translation elongation factor Ts [Anaerohalosphaeraceae bacterium]
MAEITAALVMKLRKMSGQGMMDCKKALEETDGNIEEAVALLRKKGLATLEKRAGRETSEGRVVCKKSDDGKTAALATLCCETDFVSKSDAFVAAADILAECTLLADADQGAEALLNTEYEGRKFSEILTDTVSKTGEKTEVGDYVRYKLVGNGVIGTYVHFNNKLGAMVEIETTSPEVSRALAGLAVDIAMHITAINPIGVDSDSIDPEVIARERAIAAEQVKNKPANIIDKIVDGKIAKFFKDNCLVDQPFVKDDTRTVGQALADTAKKAGGQAKIKRFVRLEIG